MGAAARSSVSTVPVTPRDAEVEELLSRLTVELAGGGYSAEQTFGYSAEQLESAGVHLVGARLVGAHTGERLVGVAGIELQEEGRAELKRFYVDPSCRGLGVADELLAALVGHARRSGVRSVRLETGDRQAAAIAFYRRNGFTPIPRFGPYVDSATSVCMERELDPS